MPLHVQGIGNMSFLPYCCSL